MLKAAILIERANIGLGGAERSVSELVAELRRQGVDALILAAKGTPSEQVKVLCSDCGGKRTSLKFYESALQSHLKDNHYDIIHSTLPVMNADIYQPRSGSYRENMLRNIASYPNPLQRLIKKSTHSLNFRRREYMRAEARVCSANSRTTIAALSAYVKEQFKRHYSVADERISIIPNGINTESCLKPSDRSRQREMICKLLQIDPAQKSVFFLFAANNPRLKGLVPLLCALKRTVGQRKDIFPVLIAAGSKGLGGCESIVSKLDLSRHVYNLNAAEGIWPLLTGCDAAVLPTFYDPCSRFILEAIAAAKPVITTRFNGASERYTNGRHGFIIDNPDDIDDLSAALLHYCDKSNIELAGKYIIEDNLRQEVSIKKHVEQLIALYNRILAEKK